MNDAGGNVIVCGDTTVSGVVELAAKNGKVRITGQNGAKLTIARTFKLASEVEFDNIELVSSSSTNGFIYAQGNKLTFGENVITSKTDGAKWFSVYGGSSSGTINYNSHIVAKTGTYHVIYGGNNIGTFTGTSQVEVSNVTVVNTLSAQNTGGTFNGTSSLILDLRGYKTVSAGTYKEIPTGIMVDDGFEAVLNGGVYAQRRIVSSADTRIYVSDGGSGDGLSAEAPIGSFWAAYDSLSMDGGEIVFVGDTTLANAVTLDEKNGDVTFSSENGAKLILNADIHLANNTNGTNVIFDLPISAADAAIFGGFKNITFTENCTVTGKLDFYGGIDTKGLEIDTSAITELAYTITVNGGTFNNFAGGNYRADYASPIGSIVAPLTVNIGGGTFTKSFSLSGMSILADSATLTVTDGIFQCDIYTLGAKGPCSASASKYSPTVHSNRKYYAADGDIAINISGGTFSGGVWASQNEVSFYQVLRGNYTVAITGGVFADNAVMDATQVKAYAGSENKATLTYADGYTFDVVRFDNVNGEDETYDEPLRVAFVGDSITEGPRPNIHLNSYPAVFASIAKENGKEIIVANYGSAGSGILTTSVYYPTRLAYPLAMEETDADYVFIAIGTNDHAAGIDNYLQKSYEDSLMSLATGFGALPDTEKVFVTTALARLNENVAQIRVASVVRPLQRRVATTLEATDGDKYVFVDLYGLTLPEVAKGTLLSSDNLHPSVSGYAKMGKIVYDAIFNGEKPSTYTLTDIYLSESGTPYGKGTEDDPTSRLDIAFSYAPAGEEVTLHVSGTISYNANIQTPLDIAKLNIVGEGEGATLAITDGGQFRTYSDAMFDNITLKTTVEDSYFIGMWNDITLSETVTLLGDWSFAAGYAAYKRDTDATASCNTDCVVTLNGSGSFQNFMLGNLRVDTAAPFGTYGGNLTATVGDGYRITGSTVGAVGQNYLQGTVSVSLPYGVACADYAPVGTVASPIVYDASHNTGKVTVTRSGAPMEDPTAIYVDGTGATAGAFATLQEAVTALKDDGGNVIVCGDTTVTGVVELAAKNGKVRITGQNGAKLTIARTFKLASEVEFDNIELVSSSSSYGFIYAQGNKLTIGENVTTSKTSGAKWFSVLGGASSGTVEYDSHLVLKAGTYYVVYGGNNQGTFTGTSTVEVSNVTVTGTLGAGSYSGTYNGTATLTVDLRGGKTVSAGTYRDTPMLLVDEGYEAVLTDGTYSQREITEPDEEPTTVYVDGTGKTEGAFTSLSAALASMPGGGTVVICGDTRISSATVLPETAAVVITSVYDDVDYTETAALQISANLTLGGDTTFENVVIERVNNADGNYYIAAAGHTLTIEESVICLNYTGYQWLSIVGGALSGTHTGGSHLVIKAGHFRNVFGGNYKGDFYGDSLLEISGGMFENAVCGGSYIGNFTGNAYVTFGGLASMLYVTGAPTGLVGGTLGSGGSNSYLFTGDTHLTVTGGAAVTTNIIGGSKSKDVSNVGDTYLTISGTPFVYYAIYAGGYASPLSGNTHAVVGGGTLWGDFFGGSYSSTVGGNSTIEITGGRLCYYKTNDASSWPEPASTKHVYGGGSAGSTLGGTATVVVRGGSIYGDVNGTAKEGSVTGKTTVTVYGGEIVGKIGSASERVIDLSGGTRLSLGVSSTVDRLIGGGQLMLAANNLLTVGTLSGTTALSINGLPLPKTYVTAGTVSDGAALNYTAQESETLTRSGNNYSIDFDGSFAETVVTVHFYEGCEIRTRAGKVDSGSWMTPDSLTATSATYTLTPGLYNSTVIYTSTNYERKFFYVDGRSGSVDVYVEFEAKQGIGYESRFAGLHTDQVLKAFYDTENIEGFAIPDSPYFNNRPASGSIVFTTHEETVAFLAEKQASCDYMYTFYPVKTLVRGFDFPVVIFTKDEIPEGASLAEIAEIVTATKGREIMMISGGVHGGEPSGAEGALAYISELCGEYGENAFASGYLGAVIILPRINPEGLYLYSRNTDADVLNPNINRDYLALSDVASQTYATIYQQFLPTLTVDLHESLSSPVWSDGDLMTDTYDGGLSYYANISSPHANTMDILYGDLAAASNTIGERMCADALHRIEAKGMRIWFYDKNPAPNFSRNYASNLGAISFTTEIPGTEADANYARRVFTQVAILKELMALTLESEGGVARAVAAARARTALSAQIYDLRRPVVIDQATPRLYNYGLFWNDPLPGADATIRYPDNPQWTDVYNVASRYRSLPTAYVIPADLAKIDSILSLLDRHGIAYTALHAGCTLSLARYSGTQSRAAVGAEQAYTFANGAYLIPVDGYRAYTTAFLFESDNTDITSGIGTLAQFGYLEVTDIYRSTESYIGAKYGVAGTYVALPTDGKTV
ncbi:MAG: hypothetical protein IJS44_04800, partial [Clostridia bacterium]|nr:hypothetical protein [Clostridia bacterium]